MNKYWFYKVGLVVVFLCFALLGGAKVKLPALVSNGMVLQHGEPVNVWGTADPDETVDIIFLKWNDIHPLDKKTLGQRVAAAILIEMNTKNGK